MPVVIITTSQGTGTRLDTLRHEFLDQLGFYHRALVSAVPSAGETTRVVLSDDLRDDGEDEGFLGGYYLYVVNGDSAGAQRRVLRDGYEGGLAAVRLSRPLAATLAINTAVEITWPLPVRRNTVVKGANDVIDEALSTITVEARLSFTGDGGRTYSLADYPWLTDESQTLGIYDRYHRSSTDELELSSARYRFVRNGADLELLTDVTYSSSDTFELAFKVRADHLIYDGSAWAYTTAPGLQNTDAYQTAADPKWVLAAAMVKGLQQYQKILVSARGMEKEERGLKLADVSERLQHWAEVEGVHRRDRMRRFTVERTDPIALVTRGRGRHWP